LAKLPNIDIDNIDFFTHFVKVMCGFILIIA